jgi:hypothetical protein
MLFPDMPQGIREMARVVRHGGLVLVNAYGDPRKVEFLGFLVRAIQRVRPGFEGPPMDPPPLPFQLQDPARLAKELAAARLREVRVETLTETTEFATGSALWEWLVFSNPIVGAVLESLGLTGEERTLIEEALENLVRERAGRAATARLTNPVNTGTARK